MAAGLLEVDGAALTLSDGELVPADALGDDPGADGPVVQPVSEPKRAAAATSALAA